MFRFIPARWLLPAALLAALIATPVSGDDTKLEELKKQMADLQKKIALLENGNAAATVVAKKPLTITDADKWRSIRGAELSPDGKWFAHRVGPAEGDGEVILRFIASGHETKFPGGGSGQMQFSSDSKWFAFGVNPFIRSTGAAPTQAPRARPKLVLVKTATGEKTELEGVSSFSFSGEAATHVAYRKAAEGSSGVPAGFPRGGPIPTSVPAPAPATPPPGVTPPHTGTDLVLRELATGVEMVFGNVAEYSFDKKGNWLVTVIDAAGQVGNGLQLRDMKTVAVYPIENGKASYRGLTWNEDHTAFTVTKAVDDAGYETKWVSILGFTDIGAKPTRTVYDPRDDKDFPKDLVISATRNATWTDSLDAFIFGLSERKKKEPPAGATPPTSPPVTKPGESTAKKDEPKKDEPKKETPPNAAVAPPRPNNPNEPKPELVVWHWKDERLQPMQQVQAALDRQVTYTGIYRVKDKKFIRLSDDTLRTVAPAPKYQFAIGRDTKPYEYMGNLDGRRYTDVYVVNMSTGERKKALTKARYVYMASPTGTHFLYYDDGHFFTYDMAAGKGTNITENVTATTFVDTDDDHNVTKPPRFPWGWSRDGKTVLLNDGWDIWAVNADGSGGKNLTGNGKETGTRYAGIVQFEKDPKPGIDLTQPLYVGMFGEWTKKDGLGRIDPGKMEVYVLLTGDCVFGQPMKARDADVFAYTRQTETQAPDYLLTDATFKDSKKVTDSNPQQKDYLWSAGAKLIDYTGTAGKKLQGVLHLPADYQPGQRYPTIVYIYEKLSQGMHRYNSPSYRGGFNQSIYTSNGYAVLTPDITYRVNDPGKSSMECILPALDAAIATGIVDPGRVALHGHSWGGYQTAFAVTQTTRFKCAIAGAPLTDLVSMYSSVYWNTGSANQPIFESSQGRFTGGYWEQQEAYIRNSPVFFAQNVQTPLLILHNDKDGAVDFTQGIEYYNTLRRLQKPVVMLQYKGENHGLAKPENQKDYASRMREFLDHHLLGKDPPDWWKDGVPHLKMDDHLKTRKP